MTVTVRLTFSPKSVEVGSYLLLYTGPSGSPRESTESTLSLALSWPSESTLSRPCPSNCPAPILELVLELVRPIITIFHFHFGLFGETPFIVVLDLRLCRFGRSVKPLHHCIVQILHPFFIIFHFVHHFG